MLKKIRKKIDEVVDYISSIIAVIILVVVFASLIIIIVLGFITLTAIGYVIDRYEKVKKYFGGQDDREKN